MTNLGTLDRTLRAILGALLILSPLVLNATGIWVYVIPAIGAGLLGSAFMGFCPAYTLFGIRTCKVKDASGN
ncbi:YgaP family membrane protein [Roseixanthobacter pseudopolyaromaticivorans]|uniref:YgaP family membrane protein n=1 Tax=Xanthobacteraceae TaxID=335928 RepID=UPI003727CF95